MCTVTFIPGREGVCITSNRDEKSYRQSLPPRAYTLNGNQIIFPKDPQAGGTWFAVHENGDAIVLLNGAYEPHFPASAYRRSRGLIVLDLIISEGPYAYFRSICLDEIEPFTLVIWEGEELFECRWDGFRKHSKHLDKTQAYIWSSATLYDAVVTGKREDWLKEWQAGNPEPDPQSVIDFHQFSGAGDRENDLRISRVGNLQTLSITSYCWTRELPVLRYLDLLTQTMIRLVLEPSNPTAP